MLVTFWNMFAQTNSHSIRQPWGWKILLFFVYTEKKFFLRFFFKVWGCGFDRAAVNAWEVDPWEAADSRGKILRTQWNNFPPHSTEKAKYIPTQRKRSSRFSFWKATLCNVRTLIKNSRLGKLKNLIFRLTP